MNKLDLIAVRDYQEEQDKNFITATWLRGLYYGNDFYRLIHKDTYFRFYNEYINKLLKRPTLKIKVACLKDSPDVILGYIIYENDRLDWCHVKDSWRRIGILKMLKPEGLKWVSHFSKVGRSLMNKQGLVFNPFLI